MSGIAERLIAGLRAQERTRPYRLERPSIAASDDGLEDALDWIWDWSDETGHRPWQHVKSDDRSPRRIVRSWLWMRWCFRAEWIERGGRDA